MLDAKNRGDFDTYLRVLAGIELFIRTHKEYEDKVISGEKTTRSTPNFSIRGDPRTYFLGYTRGLFPDLEDYEVLRAETVEKISEIGIVDDRWLLVNRNTPLEARFRMRQLAEWVRANPDAHRPLPDYGRALVTIRNGYLYGRFAHALACGAHLAVVNEVPWNELSLTYGSYKSDREMLRDWWEVSTAEDWGRRVRKLLGEDDGVWLPQVALQIRNQIASRFGVAVDQLTWREAIVEWCRGESIADAAVQNLLELPGRILCYESRFRADGVLPPDDFVRSAMAWDYGRAVNMARWGLAAYYCDRETAEKIILRAGELCRENYASWNDLSAGYILGRVLHFDEEEFGEWYHEICRVHNILVSDRASPWVNISFW